MHRRLTLLASLALFAAPLVAAAEDLVVIVHAERSASLDLDQIRQIYLRQRRFWANGDPIVPINRNADSETRRAFDRRVFGTDPRRLALYWNRAYFRGVLPPATLASDQAVLRYVAGDPRAIGYLPRSAVDDRVRIVFVLEAAASSSLPGPREPTGPPR